MIDMVTMSQKDKQSFGGGMLRRCILNLPKEYIIIAYHEAKTRVLTTQAVGYPFASLFVTHHDFADAAYPRQHSIPLSCTV